MKYRCINDHMLQVHENYISSTYPKFLEKFGIDSAALSANEAEITDKNGKVYIDCVGGYGVVNIGHNNKKVIEGLKNQIDKASLVTKPFLTNIPEELAEKLAEISPGDLSRSFICNSGSEAIDTAIKLVRLHKKKKKIITAKNSFHGYTIGALSASGIEPFRRPFKPLLGGFDMVPFGDYGSILKTISPDTGGILLEPVQHEAGVSVPPDDYLVRVRKLCDERDIILVIDEVKTGFGKTGKMFACELFGVVPDILVMGKSMGGGVMPIGGIIAGEKLWNKFSLSFPMTASSYSGNALSCRAAIETIDILTEGNLIEEVILKGDEFLGKLKSLGDQYRGIIREINGVGLLIGIRTLNPKIAFEICRSMIGQGVLILPAFGNKSWIMVEPPFVISKQQIEIVIKAFSNTLQKLNV